MPQINYVTSRLRSGVVIAVLAVASIASAADKAKPAPPKLRVDVFAAKEANVNAFVFSNGKGTLIVDATRNSKEATQLAKLARSKGPAPEKILITHGHPDHFLGVGQLHKEFPSAKIVVASKDIRDDIIYLANFLEKLGGLEGEPHMKVKSEKNPNGFDYEKNIEILSGKQFSIPGGGTLEIDTSYPPTEAPHLTTLYSKDLNAFFGSDLVYEKTHLWLGIGVFPPNVESWKKALDRLAAKYRPMKTAIYPGHGKITDASIFEMNKKYIDELLRIVKKSKTAAEAKEAMMKIYPGYADVEFLLVQSIDFQMSLLKPKQSEGSDKDKK